MADEPRRKKVKGPKTRLSQKGFPYADIGYFCEDIEDVQKFGRFTITFVVLKSDVLAFDPQIERFVEIKKSSRYNAFKSLLDTAENDLIGERDGVWFFVGKEIDGYQGWVYWRDGLTFYQLQGLVPIVED
jgi:hypothetical protein